ncbi:hypothetical protein [Streptomyces sp. NPDC051994]|uniref:hypothetical protein n=1 Tax=unclassified Streptomyces TaxID=2593676 RepID=UPI0034161C5F
MSPLSRTARRLLIPAVPLALLLVGCGTGAARIADTPVPRGAEALVLRAQHYPSSPAPAATPLPGFALYGDSRIYTPGPTTGALTGVEVQLLTERAVDRLYRSALKAGLDQPHTYDRAAPDAPGLVVVLGVAGRHVVTKVVLPDAGEKGRRGDVARLAAFTPDRLPATDRAGGPAPYAYSGLAVTATVRGTGTASGARPWPLNPLAAGEPVNGGSCTVLRGADLDHARHLLTSARPDSLWTSEGSTFLLHIRPLLPGEHNCHDLKLPG